jgi:hypothetical protein
MRTTLDISDPLLVAAKRRALEKGTTLTAFVEDALAAALARPRRTGESYRLEWTTHTGRLPASVDVADRDQLLDFMDGRR